MSTWAGIVRVSQMGDRRADADDFHADREQRAAIERALPPGAKLKIVPPELGVSGGLPLEKRPSLLAAIEGVESGKYEGIIVAYLSRLGRNTREQLRAWDRVEAAGGRIICALENIDTATPSGRFMRTVLLANAERERDEHIERFTNLRKWATEAGIWQSKYPPLGYERDPQTRRLVPSSRAPDVQRAFRDRAHGATIAQIARDLGLTSQGASRLLRNRVYLGELRLGKVVNLTAHPALIDEAKFRAAQRAVAPSRTQRFSEPALLRGIVRCASCGVVMTRAYCRSVVYHCHGVGRATPCPAPAAITLANLDAHIESVMRPVFEQMRIRAIQDDNADDERKALARAKDELAAYLAGVSAADIGAEAFGEGARARQAAVREAEQALDAKLAILPELFTEASYDDLSVTAKNEWLRGWIDAVVVERSGGRGVIRPLDERVRIVRRGFLDLPARYARSSGLRPIPFADLDDESVVRPLAA